MPYKNPYCVLAALLLACAPLARAAESGLAQKQALLEQTADLLQQLSDQDYIDIKSQFEAKPGAGHLRASRAEAIASVYSTLAALEYNQALKTGPAPDARPNVEAALQTRLKEDDALMINPDTLEQTGLWGDFVEYVNRDPAPSYRGAAVAAVRGGREIDTEADKKAAKIKRSLKDLEPRLKQPGLAAPELAALHYEKGRLYEILAESAVIEKPQAPEAPKTAQPPVQTAEDAVKCETKEMDSLEKRMQDEVERRRARVK